jgi:hypothetical protein
VPLLGLPIDARKIVNEFELIIHQKIIQSLLMAEKYYSIKEICDILDNNPELAKGFIGQISAELD